MADCLHHWEAGAHCAKFGDRAVANGRYYICHKCNTQEFRDLDDGGRTLVRWPGPDRRERIVLSNG